MEKRRRKIVTKHTICGNQTAKGEAKNKKKTCKTHLPHVLTNRIIATQTYLNCTTFEKKGQTKANNIYIHKLPERQQIAYDGSNMQNTASVLM